MRASVIIPQREPGWPTGLTIDCLQSLKLHHPGRVVEVLIYTGVENIHEAWNQGGDEAQTDLLVWLNNDTLTKGPWLRSFLAPLLDPAWLFTTMGERTERALPRKVLQKTGAIFGQGWCFAARKETFLAHRFDPSFGLYFGDTDWQARFGRSRLWAARFEPNLLHLGHRTTRATPQQTAASRQQWRRDRETFIQKWTEAEP